MEIQTKIDCTTIRRQTYLKHTGNPGTLEDHQQDHCFLGKQTLPLRGRREGETSTNKGNFLELVELRCHDNEQLRYFMRRSVTYTSPKIQNEIINIIGAQIQEQIVSEIKASGPYGIIVDETQDLSREEQVSVCIRYVCEQTGITKERFLGLWTTASTSGEALFRLLKNVLTKLGLDLESLRAQCYDGAANMRGKYSGLSTKMREVENRALYVHCYAHQLNLTLQHATQPIPQIRNCLGSVQSLYNFIAGSSKRHNIFSGKQREAAEGTPAHPLASTSGTDSQPSESRRMPAPEDTRDEGTECESVSDPASANDQPQGSQDKADTRNTFTTLKRFCDTRWSSW